MTNRWGNNGNSERLYFIGLQITVDGDCSHKTKRCFLLGRQAMTKPDSILKSEDITLSVKVRLVKAMVFPAVTHGCKSWTIKKAKHQRIDAFELWYWRRLYSHLETLKNIKPFNPKWKTVLNIHWKD